MDKPYTDDEIAAALVLERLTYVDPLQDRWLRTLRRMVVALVGALLAASASVVILVAVVASKTHGDDVTQDVTDCRNLFNGEVADATKATSDAVGQMMVELVRAVVNRTATSPPFDPTRTNAAVAEWDKASADYGAALADRNAWVADGTPLPCPLKP